MPDRFDRFSSEELHEIRYGLGRAKRDNTWAGRPECAELCQKLEDEIADRQIQREHAEARQRVSA
jgi:hypothetical protein